MLFGMASVDFQRARQPEQKEQRRADILHAAGEMLAEEGVDGLSLNALARRVGLAKSNVYRYFESREAILIELLFSDWSEWVDELEQTLGKLRAKKNRVRRVSEIVARSCAERRRMCELISVLSSVLEQNVSEETVRAFKTDALELGLRMATMLHEAIPELSVEQHVELIHLTHALIAGSWAPANPPPVVRKVLEDPELSVLCHDFERDLARGIELLVLGLQQQ